MHSLTSFIIKNLVFYDLISHNQLIERAIYGVIDLKIKFT